MYTLLCCCCSGARSSTSTILNKIRTKHRKANPKLQTKGRKIQKETNSRGWKTPWGSRAILNNCRWSGKGSRFGFFKWKNLSASPWDMGRKPKPNKKTPSDSFQVQTAEYFTLLSSLEKWMLERGGDEGFTKWWPVCSTRKERGTESRWVVMAQASGAAGAMGTQFPTQSPAWHHLSQSSRTNFPDGRHHHPEGKPPPSCQWGQKFDDQGLIWTCLP